MEQARRHAARRLAQLLAAFTDLTAEADAFTGTRGSVGVGVPGLIDPDDGTLFTANVPAARGRALGRDLSRLLGREVRVDNDANCFASPRPGTMSFRPVRWCWA